MKIVTVNVPESYISAISKLVGDNGLYPSRSELIRCAVRDFLLKELNIAKNMQKWDIKEPEIEEPEIEEFDDKNFVRIPVSRNDENNEPFTEYKTYKILREA